MTHEKEIKELIEAGEKARDVTWRYSGRLRAIRSPLEPFEPIIVNVVSLPEYEGNGKFIEKAANSRPAIKSMYEENLRLKAENEWQPIETAPKDGTEIIITDGYDVHTGKFRKSNVINNSPYFCKSCDGSVLNDGYDWENIPIYMHEPTHWKPLPTPPQENE